MTVDAHHLHLVTGPHELFNEMAVGLLTTADRYDPARGRPEEFAGVQLRPAPARLRQTKSVPADRFGPDDDRLGQVTGDDPEPADIAVAGEQIARLREAVNELPDRQRAAVTLRFGLGGGEAMSWDGGSARSWE